MLTHRQHELLIFLRDYQVEHNGVSPALWEMARALGLKSKSGTHRILSALEYRGFIARRNNEARSVTILKVPEVHLDPARTLQLAVAQLVEEEGTEAVVSRLADISHSLLPIRAVN